MAQLFQALMVWLQKLPKNYYASSLSFSTDLVRGVHARASVERRSLETREKRALPSRAFGHARGHLRVSRVLLDGPRIKGDCS